MIPCDECSWSALFRVTDPKLRLNTRFYCEKHARDLGAAIYISGPITGIRNRNKEAFTDAERQLNATNKWTSVVNPQRLAADVPFPAYADFMRKDIRSITACSAIALLPGYSASPGSRLEVSVAEAIGLDIKLLEDWVN